MLIKFAKSDFDKSVSPVINNVCKLFLVHTLLHHIHNVTEVKFIALRVEIIIFKTGYVKEQQVHTLSEMRAHILAQLRPNAVALADAWQFR